MVDFKDKLLKGEFVAKVQEATKGITVDTPEMIRNIIDPIISYEDDREHFCTLFLDAKNRINHMEVSFEGSLSGCSVYPREIIKKGLKHKAAAMIFVHNHPSGDLTISPADKKITKLLVMAADLHEITVHDHIIINKETQVSMNVEGIISNIKEEWSNFKNKDIYC